MSHVVTSFLPTTQYPPRRVTAHTRARNVTRMNRLCHTCSHPSPLSTVGQSMPQVESRHAHKCGISHGCWRHCTCLNVLPTDDIVCPTLQHTARHCNTLQHTARHCNTLQHAATHCTTLQHTATHCNTLQHAARHCNTLQHATTHCTTLQHTATHCNTLQHTAAHCNTLHDIVCPTTSHATHTNAACDTDE